MANSLAQARIHDQAKTRLRDSEMGADTVVILRFAGYHITSMHIETFSF